MSVITTKLHEILLSDLWGVALTRKTGLTDWLTDRLIDGRVENIIPSATRCVGYKNIHKCLLFLTLQNSKFVPFSKGGELVLVFLSRIIVFIIGWPFRYIIVNILLRSPLHGRSCSNCAFTKRKITYYIKDISQKCVHFVRERTFWGL